MTNPVEPPSVPSQERSMDPYADYRYSSSLNRLTRSLTFGKPAILFPNESFLLERVDNNTITVGPGVFIKDDVVVHIQLNDDDSKYSINFSEPGFYAGTDAESAMNVVGRYYIVIMYDYTRSLPAPKAYFRIIKYPNTDYNTSSHIFIGAVDVTLDGTLGIHADGDLYYEDVNASRPYIQNEILHLDGGTL